MAVCHAWQHASLLVEDIGGKQYVDRTVTPRRQDLAGPTCRGSNARRQHSCISGNTPAGIPSCRRRAGLSPPSLILPAAQAAWVPNHKRSGPRAGGQEGRSSSLSTPGQFSRLELASVGRYQDQNSSPLGGAFLHRPGLRAARRRLRHSSPSCHADPLARVDVDERPHELVPELAVREERLRQVVRVDGATPHRSAPAVPVSSPCSPRTAAHGRASGVAAMLAYPEEQGSPSCKANVRSTNCTGRPKLVKFNDRHGPMAASSQRNLNHCCQSYPAVRTQFEQRLVWLAAPNL